MVHAIALSDEDRCHAAIAIARMCTCKLSEPLSQVLFIEPGLTSSSALGGAGLSDHLARETLRDAKLFLETADGRATTTWAQNFPELMILNASISSSLFATMRLSCAFSFSSSLSRSASSAFIPPYWFLQR